jgi:hypothetical protein
MMLGVEELLSTVRDMREALPVFRPVVIWQPHDDDPLVVTIEGSTGNVSTDLNEAFGRVRELAGPPEWFAVALDSYARDNDPDGVPGSLEEAFLNGDMTVVEQVVVIVQSPESGLTMFRQIYRNTPVDGWEWDEPQLVTDPDDEVCTAIRMFH